MYLAGSQNKSLFLFYQEQLDFYELKQIRTSNLLFSLESRF